MLALILQKKYKPQEGHIIDFSAKYSVMVYLALNKFL